MCLLDSEISNISINWMRRKREYFCCKSVAIDSFEVHLIQNMSRRVNPFLFYFTGLSHISVIVIKTEVLNTIAIDVIAFALVHWGKRGRERDRQVFKHQTDIQPVRANEWMKSIIMLLIRISVLLIAQCVVCCVFGICVLYVLLFIQSHLTLTSKYKSWQSYSNCFIRS